MRDLGRVGLKISRWRSTVVVVVVVEREMKVRKVYCGGRMGEDSIRVVMLMWQDGGAQQGSWLAVFGVAVKKILCAEVMSRKR